jgi:hypothetical protein
LQVLELQACDTILIFGYMNAHHPTNLWPPWGHNCFTTLFCSSWLRPLLSRTVNDTSCLCRGQCGRVPFLINLTIVEKKKNEKLSQALVAHTCNPSYLGGWDQEDHSSRPSPENSSQDSISRITRETDWRCGSKDRAPALQSCSPESNLQSYQKKRMRSGQMTWRLSISSPRWEGDRGLTRWHLWFIYLSANPGIIFQLRQASSQWHLPTPHPCALLCGLPSTLTTGFSLVLN